MPDTINDMEEEDIELYEEKYEKALQEKRHKELVSSIKALSNLLKTDNGKSEISKLMADNSKVIDAFIEKLKEVTVASNVPPTPEIKIEQNNEEFVDLITKLGEKITQGLQMVADKLDKIEEKPEYVFKVSKRNEHSQNIEEITAKIKK